MIASIISMMRCSAESAPMVMSVPQKSLSMEPTRPTMFRWLCCLARASVILPVARECYRTCCTGCTHNNVTGITAHSMVPSRTLSASDEMVSSVPFHLREETKALWNISDFHLHTYCLHPSSQHWQKPKPAEANYILLESMNINTPL